MNSPSEQIRPDLSLDITYDQVLTPKEQCEQLAYFLGEENCSVIELYGKKVFLYRNGNKKIILLHRAISYLGNPHPTFKKRVQLPSWYKEFLNGKVA